MVQTRASKISSRIHSDQILTVISQTRSQYVFSQTESSTAKTLGITSVPNSLLERRLQNCLDHAIHPRNRRVWQHRAMLVAGSSIPGRLSEPQERVLQRPRSLPDRTGTLSPPQRQSPRAPTSRCSEADWTCTDCDLGRIEEATSSPKRTAGQ